MKRGRCYVRLTVSWSLVGLEYVVLKERWLLLVGVELMRNHISECVLDFSVLL